MERPELCSKFAETRGEAVGSSEHERGSLFRDEPGVATNL